MNSHPLKSPSTPAFTLIELLTVIAIIAILMGLLFPAIAAVRENARRTQAKNDVNQIVVAVKQYYTEYSKYPPLEAPGTAVTGTPVTTDLYVGDTDKSSKAKAHNSALFDTLRAISRKNSPNENDLLNPRRIVFFEAKVVANPDAPRSGVLEKTTATATGGGTATSLIGCLYDPWGKEYFVMMDTNGDDKLDMGQCYKDFGETNPEDKPRTGVGAFSMGKDNDIGDVKNAFTGSYRQADKVSDDVISWQ